MSKTIRFIKLSFKTAVHFGSSHGCGGVEGTEYYLHSDTLFSALFIETLRLFGETAAQDFADKTKEGEIILSSLLPFNEKGLFVPKPLMVFEREKQLESNSKLKKQLKNLQFIAADNFNDYISFLEGKHSNAELFCCGSAFGEVEVQSKVWVIPDGDNKPYVVSVFHFNKDCGLYFILVCEDSYYNDVFAAVLDSLSYSGLGGKRSWGYGRFSFCLAGDDETATMRKMMDYANSANVKMLVSVCLPESENWHEYALGYKLLWRKGYIESQTYATTQYKKKSVAVIAEGSCFNAAPLGIIADVGQNGAHPVYRNGKALCLGVETNA